jgi:Na+-transporting methylmalonyl-CoA/oxaloacetate decarboxylase gamma subunit
MPISARTKTLVVCGSRGGGMSIVFLGMAVIFLVMLIFVNAVDYSLYSAKRSMISRAVDYSVCAAVQEIDIEKSKEGLSLEYDEDTGVPSAGCIFLDEEKADNAFFSTFHANTGIDEASIKRYVMRVVVDPLEGSLECRFKKDGLDAVQNQAYPAL